MGPLTVAAFLVACLLGTGFPSIATSLCLSLFATKQVLQASATYFRDSLAGSQSINVAVGLVAAIAAIRRIVSDPTRLHGFLNSTWYLTIALYLWAIISCSWSYAGRQGLEVFATGAPYLILFPIIVPLLIADLEDWCRVTWVWLLLATCVAALILINPEFTTRSGRLGLDLGVAGLKSTRTNPLEIGAAGGYCLMLGILYQSATRPTLVNWIRIIAVLVGTALAIRSGSRGQFVFALISAVLAFPIAKPITDFRRAAVSLVSLVILLVVILLLADRVRSSGSFEDERRWTSSEFSSGSDVRFVNILLLLGEYAASPSRWLTGLGFYSYSTLDPTQEYSHCTSVDALAELGLIGAAIYTTIILQAFWFAKQVFGWVSDSPRLRNGLGCLVGMLIYQFLLANKQGNLVGSNLLFGTILLLARIRISEMHQPSSQQTEPEAESHEDGSRVAVDADLA